MSVTEDYSLMIFYFSCLITWSWGVWTRNFKLEALLCNILLKRWSYLNKTPTPPFFRTHTDNWATMKLFSLTINHLNLKKTVCVSDSRDNRFLVFIILDVQSGTYLYVKNSHCFGKNYCWSKRLLPHNKQCMFCWGVGLLCNKRQPVVQMQLNFCKVTLGVLSL